MGVVEDIRQVIQGLVAPQLKSLDTRVTSLESTMNQRFASVEAIALARHEAVTAQLAQLASTTSAQIAQLTNTLEHLATVVATNHKALLEKLDLDRRVERIEFAQSAYTASRYKALEEVSTLDAPARVAAKRSRN